MNDIIISSAGSPDVVMARRVMVDCEGFGDCILRKLDTQRFRWTEQL